MKTPRPAPLRSLERSAIGLATLLTLAACAGRAPEPIDTQTSAIVGGSADDSDQAAVWIVADVKGRTGYCSGVVVSPYVVLTAGHCSSAEATYSIFLGSDYRDAGDAGLVAVSEHHPHPKYDPMTNLYDVGVLVTSSPIPRKPASINRTPLSAADRGAPIRIVGFGRTAATDPTIGRRHSAITTLADYDSTGLKMVGTPNFCLFDSGGPTFLERGGAQVVAGVHSIVESAACDQGAWDARVDVAAPFIDDMIARTIPPQDDGGTDGPKYEPGAAEQASPAPSAPGGCATTAAPRPSAGTAMAALCLVVGFLARRRASGARERRVE